LSTDRILLTGSTGFIGRQATERLLARGCRLRLLVRDAQQVPRAWRDHSAIEVAAPIDLAENELRPAVEGVETVVHLGGLAGLVGARQRDAETLFLRNNAQSTERLVQASAAMEVRRFVHLSSIMSVTANVAPTPIDDATSPRPNSAYGRSNLNAEQHVTALGERGACLAVSLRPPLVIGSAAKGNWRALQRLAAQGWPLPLASLTAKRSFISVASLIEAIISLCESTALAAQSGSYCIADPEPLTLPEVMSELRHGMNLSPRLFGFPPAALAALGRLAGKAQQVSSLTGPLQIDPSRFYKTFGFAPSLPLRDAMRQSAADYLAARGGR
jgi:UDP-glucose 4-epimerase